MIPKKPVPDLIWDANGFSDQIMRYFIDLAGDGRMTP
jgi:hypothetical protein